MDTREIKAFWVRFVITCRAILHSITLLRHRDARLMVAACESFLRTCRVDAVTLVRPIMAIWYAVTHGRVMETMSNRACTAVVSRRAFTMLFVRAILTILTTITLCCIWIALESAPTLSEPIATFLVGTIIFVTGIGTVLDAITHSFGTHTTTTIPAGEILSGTLLASRRLVFSVGTIFYAITQERLTNALITTFEFFISAISLLARFDIRRKYFTVFAHANRTRLVFEAELLTFTHSATFSSFPGWVPLPVHFSYDHMTLAPTFL